MNIIIALAVSAALAFSASLLPLPDGDPIGFDVETDARTTADASLDADMEAELDGLDMQGTADLEAVFDLSAE